MGKPSVNKAQSPQRPAQLPKTVVTGAMVASSGVGRNSISIIKQYARETYDVEVEVVVIVKGEKREYR